MAQEVTIRSVEWSPEVVAALKAAEAFDTTGGMLRVEDYQETGVPFVVEQNGNPVGWYVLSANRYAAGNEGVIAYAAGRASFDLVERCLPIVERQFVGCDVLRVETCRRSLVKKMAKQGWQLAGFIMRKRPNHVAH